jgi:hypothetical protein
MKKLMVVLLVLSSVGYGGYFIGTKNAKVGNTKTIDLSLDENGLKQDLDVLNCPFRVKGGVFNQYIKSNNETEVVGKPQLIENPEIIKFDNRFVESEFKERLAMYASGGKWDTREFDVDADGKNEIIINADITMNHTPNMGMIVKDGRVIFEETGGGVWIEKVDGHQGFMISEEVDRQIGEYVRTRYVSKDGGFIPVWKQKSCWVQFE